MRRGVRSGRWVVLVAIVATACSSTGTTPEREVASENTTADEGATSTSIDTDAASTTEADAATTSSAAPTTTAEPGELSAFAGTEQVTVFAAPGLAIELTDSDGAALATERTDDTGALVVRDLPGGIAVTVRAADADLGSVEVTTRAREEHPPAAFYAEQRLPAPGYGYLTTRDGTELSVNVRLPGDAADGPYPTVVEYSGYDPSNPEAAGLGDLFTSLGYAYVGVNMRGTGCSGGSFRYFEYSQSLDGYDAIETIADQPWVLDNRVGMVGVSYPGISQLFVAQTQPPSLAAITPLSVIEDSYGSTSYPGGILNTGFAVDWISQRQTQAEAAGQQWTADRIAAGDEQCDANQRLRSQNPDLVGEIVETEYRTEPLASELAPAEFVDRINVPVFIAGAWQDEQTGGRFPTMLDEFTSSPARYASLTNGLHIDSAGPRPLVRMVEFLELYVARRTPDTTPLTLAGPLLAAGLFGTNDVDIPPNRFEDLSYEEALAAFEAEPSVEVHFETGAADGRAPGSPNPRFVVGFEGWPIGRVEATQWWLGSDGALAAVPPAAAESTAGDGASGDAGGDAEASAGGDVGAPTAPATTTYRADPRATPATFYEGSSSGVWRADVEWSWVPNRPGTAATFTTPPLSEDVVMVGSGSADLWISATSPDTDIEVTLVEVLPDGSEVYVQSGWLRASHRVLDADASTELRPVHTHRADDAAPLPDDELTPVRVEIFPFAHVFRAGSSLRLVVDAPGGNRAVWVFDSVVDGETVTIAHDVEHPSRLVLPVVPGIEVPPGAPACGSLRGQPCRAQGESGATGP